MHSKTKPPKLQPSNNVPTTQKLNDFLLVHESPHQSGWAPVRVIDHYLNMSAGTSSTMWKVPALKDKR